MIQTDYAKEKYVMDHDNNGELNLSRKKTLNKQPLNTGVCDVAYQ